MIGIMVISADPIPGFASMRGMARRWRRFSRRCGHRINQWLWEVTCGWNSAAWLCQ